MLEAGPYRYTYDANGNMTAGAGRTIRYDAENRPVDIDGVGFVYGPDGARLKKIAGGVATLYLGDDVEITGGQVTKYLPGGAKRVNSDTYWLHRDHLGSTRAVTDLAGAEVQRLNYRPYGERLSTATAFPEAKSWIGERQDAETGLFYLHARTYDPVLGHFVSADPSDPTRPGVGLNRYAYAGNNPITRLDRSGLSYGPDIDDPGGPVDFGDNPVAEVSGRSRDDDDNGLATMAPVHFVLDLLGLVPVFGNIPDAINGGLYGLEGDLENAGWSGAAAVPGAGQVAIGAKYGKRGIEALSKAGRVIDPADKGGELTKAGRALDKHGRRPGSAFPEAKGSKAQKNRQGQEELDGIVNNPESTVGPNKKGGVDVVAPDGKGARFDKDGSFSGFLAPPKEF